MNVKTQQIIEYGQVTTYNANRPHGFGMLNPNTFAPYPKNPVMGAFFRQIDRADELGSGMRKLMLYGKKYGNTNPQLIEGDVFRMIIKVPKFGASEIVTNPNTPQVTPQVANLIEVMSGEMSRSECMALLSLKDRMHVSREYLQPALGSGYIEMTIPCKPNSRLHKYRLTAKGLQYRENLL